MLFLVYVNACLLMLFELSRALKLILGKALKNPTLCYVQHLEDLVFVFP